MPLQVFNEYDHNSQARRVYVEGRDLNPYRRYDVSMYAYAVVDNQNEPTGLGTSGAGPCQIIIVHKARGRGALGHFAGHNDPWKIIQGVSEMIDRLGGGPIETVVLAAGQVDFGHSQDEYQSTILARVGAMCPGAQVLWPTPPEGNVWGDAYYLPLAEAVGLFEFSPGMFVGSGNTNASSGITSFCYGSSLHT